MKRTKYIFLVLLAAAITFIVYNQRQQEPAAEYQKDQGRIFGTMYNISYDYPANLKKEIEEELKEFDYSLSPFNPNSIITKVNLNDTTVILDKWFINVFESGKRVAQVTDGAFDYTVAPLVNLWGFGFKKSDSVNEQVVDSILQFVGYTKVALVNGKIIKQDPRTMIDASAIAKGYACDVVAELLRSRGIVNFMVEIGGEIVAGGVNPKGKMWRVGINKPIDDSTSMVSEIEEVVEISNMALATSGNYRNFYVKDGKKYAHTINPQSGYPIQHNLLSATVVAPDCMTADAFATAFMVMGLEESLRIVDADPSIEAYFIYTDEETGAYKTFASEGLKKYIVK
ncbi:MAG: FAD:protein FMN transferase [Bacteroidales bacterium]